MVVIQPTVYTDQITDMSHKADHGLQSYITGSLIRHLEVFSLQAAALHVFEQTPLSSSGQSAEVISPGFGSVDQSQSSPAQQHSRKSTLPVQHHLYGHSTPQTQPILRICVYIWGLALFFFVSLMETSILTAIGESEEKIEDKKRARVSRNLLSRPQEV